LNGRYALSALREFAIGFCDMRAQAREFAF
jgi:hypothetical protein